MCKIGVEDMRGALPLMTEDIVYGDRRMLDRSWEMFTRGHERDRVPSWSMHDSTVPAALVPHLSQEPSIYVHRHTRCDNCPDITLTIQYRTTASVVEMCDHERSVSIALIVNLHIPKVHIPRLVFVKYLHVGLIASYGLKFTGRQDPAQGLGERGASSASLSPARQRQ